MHARLSPQPRRSSEIAAFAVSAALLVVQLIVGPPQFDSDQVPKFFTWRELWWTAPACAAFALVAWALRGVTLSGAVAGFAVAWIVALQFGFRGFAVLTLVFALTWAATRGGKRRKQALGLAERPSGRTGMQVLANVGVAALLALASRQRSSFYLASMAVLAEAAADTVASEIGQAFGGAPRLITTFRRVPVGANGGATILGSGAGIVAAALVAAAALKNKEAPFDILAIIAVTLIATAGMLFDSILGATLEGRLLKNDGVNFLSTAFCGALTLALWIWLVAPTF